MAEVQLYSAPGVAIADYLIAGHTFLLAAHRRALPGSVVGIGAEAPGVIYPRARFAGASGYVAMHAPSNWVGAANRAGAAVFVAGVERGDVWQSSFSGWNLQARPAACRELYAVV